MDGEDRKQFICRYCDKKFQCGKSLGGHLRSHTIARAVKDRTLIQNAIKPKPKPNLDESAAYVLRENPKKTWRFGGAAAAHGGATKHQPERFCKECGKGFQSMKALCGHMACHSDKDKALVSDSQSETETASGPRRGKRSKRLRYKSLDFNSNSSMSHSVANGSSSVSEIEQEQEEVAMCLMMLSRDFGYSKGFNTESSDNNSVVLEAKSSSIDMNKNLITSGYFRNEAKRIKLKSDGFESFERKQMKQIKAEESRNLCPIYGRSTRIKDHDELWDKNGFNSKIINGCCDSICESGENSIEADSFHNSKAKVNKKRLGTKKSKGHKCPICFRVFKSGQALGGHKRSHFLGGSDGRTVVVLAKQQVGLLDLNLPAPDEEEDSGRGFMGR